MLVNNNNFGWIMLAATKMLKAKHNNLDPVHFWGKKDFGPLSQV